MKRVLTTKNLLIFIHAILILSFTHTKVFSQSVATPANTTISNFAKGVYEDDRGVSYETISSTVSIDVKVVSSLVVTPNQTSPTETVAPNETLVREFEVCNTSNNSDSYTVTGASVTAPAGITDIFYDLDDNGEISAGDIRVELNQPLSNIVSPGSCIKILVRLNTNDIATSEQLRIDLTVRSNNTDAVNGQAQDTGRIINSGGKAAVFTNPADPALIPRKLVQDRSSYVSGKGEQLTYEISFRNSGDVDARNVAINDELPAELNYIPNTLKLETKALTDAADGDEGEVSGKTLTVRLSRPVKPNEVVSISLKATVSQNVIPGRGVVNVATITADNAKTATTSEAIAVVDPFGTVYAARGGAGSPIPGATVTILTDSTSGSILPIPQGQGFEPNFKNLNPYVTDNRGRFSFGLLPSQLGTESQPARYVVSVSAENFRPRLLEITLRPDGNGLFRMTVRSLDGLPIAVADGFELTVNDVEIPSIADVAFNIPLFEEATLEVSKTADRAQAEVGDIANYRIEVRNSSVAPLLNVRVKDTLPDSFTYVEDTARITRGSAASPIKPVINGNVMEFGIGDLLSGEGVSIQYRVRIGVNARRGDNFNSAVVSGTFPSGEENVSEPSRALVKVSPGLFSMRQFVIGRVFVDKNNNGVFDYGERPVAGARIYLSNGNSATTDTQGLYSVPAVSEGAQVIAIDPITIPKGYVLSNGGRRSGKDWTRLLRTPLGGGAMLRQNFALLSDGTVKDDQDEIVKTALDKPAGKKPVSVLPEESSDQNEYKAVAPGEVFVHKLENGSVAPKTSVNIDVSVAEGWSARIEAGQAKFGTENIGTTRNDPANKITTFTFVGIGLKPGPNKIRAFPVSPEGISGKPLEIEIFGRGAASRLKVAAERSELQASGRDSTTIVVEAYDEWGHPAQDGSVIVRTSSGRFFDPTKSEEENEDASEGSVMREDLFATNGSTSEQENGSLREQKIELVNGIGIVKLISDNKTGTARVTAIQGKAEGYSDIRFTSETRPGFLAGLAEVTIGKNAPEMANRATDENVRGRIQFFYKGKFFSDKNNLTVAYDSQEPLNRVSGQDRLFQLNPVDQVYPLFGDSSTRFQETESNSKVYARIDRGRSYAMFGDFDAGLDSNRLLGFSRRLTGAKVHVENRNGDFVTVTGARPDTAFARQVIAGGSLGLIQLNYADVLPGSEVLMIETRDRRNPELILSREVLSRSVDYNIDTTTGTIFFLRSIPTFDRDLNLIQIVATYEYRSEGFESSVYTARGAKTFNRLGLRLGFSYVNQRQDEESPFQLGGIDGSLKLPNRGRLDFEWATSRGPLNHGYSFFGNSQSGDREFNGNAFFVSLEQPLSYGQTVLRFEGFSASGNFYNPFGATVTAGSTRGALSIESKPLKNGTVKVNLVAEKNHTENVDNNRITAGIQWSQRINEKLKFNFGYDFRRYSDNDADRSVLSNLITVGAEYKPTSKLDFSIKREQNLGAEDPSYPNQTLIGANYQLNQFAKVFFTQRLASNPITPISDVSGTGFASSNARYETAVGVETQFGKYTSLSGRYQLENGLNGTDSFSIIGLKNRIPVSEKLSLEAGYERAFHLAGEGKSYNNFTLGANWLPDENFRSSFRYELRDREGFGHLFSLGAAGKLRPGWTTLGRLQYGDVNYNGRKNFAMNGQLALAIRPHNTDKYGLLLSYKHRENFFSGGTEDTQNELRDDIFSVDGFHQTTRRLELYGRFAAKFSADQTPDIPFASNLSYLAQARAQYLLSDSFDVAIEGRYMYQPTTGSQNRWLGIEAGYWVTPELRIGGGYNFKQSTEVFGFNNDQVYNKGGFYFSITTKLSRLFDLFGTSDKGLEHTLPGGKYPQSAKNEDRKDK